MKELSADGFSEAHDAIAAVIDAVSQIGPWIDAHIPPPSLVDDASLVDRHLRCTAQLAAQHDQALADSISRLIAGAPVTDVRR